MQRFEDITVDSRSMQVLRANECIALEPKSLRVLLYLIDNRDRLVTKEELISAIWADTFVSDNSLTRAVAQLRKALGDDAKHAKYIQTFPRLGYRFVAEVSTITESVDEAAVTVPAADSHLRRQAWMKPRWAVPLVLLAIGAAGIWIYRVTNPRALKTEAFRVRPLTSYPGGQYEPAFSPDGSQVAFVWNGEKQDNFDIYVKFIDGGTPLRLTTNPAGDGSPAWSPDGRRIAFLRYSAKVGESGFYVIPAIGGAERQVGQAAFLPHIFDRHLDWSPDGRFLAVVDKDDPGGQFAIFLISVETGQRRRITSPPAKSIGDTGPAFAPDGRTIAFKRTASAGVNDIYLVSTSGGEPARLTFGNNFTSSHAWSSNGRELVFSNAASGSKGLWRIPASGGTPRQLPSIGQEAYYLAISRKGNYLAYSHWFADTNVWRLPISRSNEPPAQPPEALIASTWQDRSAQYSPDGSRIAFRSDRSGTDEIWVCDSSGTNPLQLTYFRGPLTGTPRWSPDGRYLAFDSRPNGNSDIYIIPATGGVTKRITNGSSENAVPSWSRDGKWIYFASNRTSDWQTWKVGVQENAIGEPLQVTRHGGFAAFESADARWLYYAKGRDASGLWKISLSDGQESPVLPDFKAGFWGYWAIAPSGIFYIDSMPAAAYGVKFYSFDKQTSSLVARIAHEPPYGDSGFAISPDGRWALYTQVDHSGSDIMLVEGFR